MSEQPVVGPVTDLAVQGNMVEISAKPAKARVVFLSDDTFRVWVAFGGKFVDETDMIRGERHRPGAEPSLTDTGPYYRLTTPALSLRIYKDRLRFGLYRPDDTTVIVEEKRPLGWDQQAGATQYLTAGRHGAVLRRRHAERPLHPPPQGDRHRRQLQLGRRRVPQLGAVLPVERRLRRVPPHLRAGAVRLPRHGTDPPPGTALRRLLLRRTARSRSSTATPPSPAGR